MTRFTLLLLVTAVILALSCGYAFGQATATGTIQGTVVDNTQAVIVGAEVVATHNATGVKRATTTNSTGDYRFELMPAGNYTVKVSKGGFASFAQTFELLVGRTASINVTMKPGATREIVEVTAEAPLVDLAKTSVSQSITPTQVQELPLVGRDAANLAYLAPGVKASDSYDPTKARYASLSVNGSDGRNVNTTVNGIDNKDNTVGGAVMQMPLEAVQEFQISTQRFSAENGRSQGAAINMITKAGTNNYHGSGFAYFRNSALDTDEKPPDGAGGFDRAHPYYNRQFFGGSVGGPFKKDKLFGFFAIERQRENQFLTETSTAFNELTLAKGAGLAAQPIAQVPRPFFEWRYNGRADWVINNKNTAYLSYSSQANNSLNDQSDGTMDLTEGNFTTNHLQIANLTLTSQLSSTMVNQFTSGFQYWRNLISSAISAPLVTFPSPASFGTNGNVPQKSVQRKWQFKDDLSKTIGKHTLKGGVDFIWNPYQGGFFEYNSTLEVDFKKDPSAILGNPLLYPQGFSTPGLVTGMSFSNGDPTFNGHTKQLGLYVQDDWKMTPHLTVNLGLRWDRDFNVMGEDIYPITRTYQELKTINNPVSNPYISPLPHDSNTNFSPRVGFAYDLTGKGNHVVRGGFGIYYGNAFQNIPLFMEQMAGTTVFSTVLSLTNGTDPVPCTGLTLSQWRYGVSPLPCLPAPATTLASGGTGRIIDPNYRNPVAEEFNIGYSWAVNPQSVFEIEYTHVLGLHENKTINIDQKKWDGTYVDVNGDPTPATSADASPHMVRPLDAAFVAAGVPRLNSVRNEASINRNRYDGLNFSYRQRMSHHFSLNANYTLSWAVGYDSGGGTDTFFRNYARDGYYPLGPQEFGPSTNDERHHITLSGILNLPKGFQIAPIVQFGTARPYNPDNSDNPLNTGGGTMTAVVVPKSNPTAFLTYTAANFAGGSRSNSDGTTSDWTASDAADWAAQICYYVSKQCVVSKYDPLRGDPFFQLDMRLTKNFKIREGMNLEFVAQAFNLTNRANYGNNLGLDITSDTFRHPIGFINPTSTYTPRSVWGEFGVHFTF